jgi:hypothetical protein
MKGIKFTQGNLEDPLLQPLYNDMAECEDLLSKADTQFARRVFVRASFAFIEGLIYWLKERVIKWLSDPEWGKDFINIDITSIILLQDATYRPNKQGKIEEEPNRIPFLNYCAFVLRTAAKRWGMNPESIFSDNGWKELQDALQIRHRITHPKQPQDLDIKDHEIDSVRESHRWLIEHAGNIAATALVAKEKNINK